MILKYEHSLRAAFNIYQNLNLQEMDVTFTLKIRSSLELLKNANTAAAKNVSIIIWKELQKIHKLSSTVLSYSRQSTTFRKLIVF
jgi:hypothetical protein